MEFTSRLLATLLASIFILIKNGQCQFGGMMPGMGGMSGMSAGMAIAGEIPPAQYMILDNAVKQIVSPTASLTPMIVQIALRQGGTPRTLPQLMEYIPHFQMLAQQLNVRPPGVTGQPTALQINNYIQQRANQWMAGNVPGFQAMNMMNPSMLATQPMVSNPAPIQMRPVANQQLPLAEAASSSAQTRPQSQPVVPGVITQHAPILYRPRPAGASPDQQNYMSPMPMYNTFGASQNTMGGFGNILSIMALSGMMDLGIGLDGLM